MKPQIDNSVEIFGSMYPITAVTTSTALPSPCPTCGQYTPAARQMIDYLNRPIPSDEEIDKSLF